MRCSPIPRSATCISAMSSAAPSLATTDTDRALLRVSEIHTYYGDSYVLQGVSLTLQKGQIAAILGRNGMGKTTLIRSVAGLTPPRSGDISYRDSSLRGKPPYMIAQAGIAIVPQGRRIFRSLSVRENLLLPTSVLARTSRTPDDLAVGTRWDLREVLREFPQLAERIDHPGGALSGGEQQMLAIGRALMANPELILMDEPSEGLSPRLVLQVQEIMKRLRARGHAILLVEQNLELALSVADQVYVLSAGQFVFRGAPAELAKATQVLDQYLGVSGAKMT
jgi:branched-chain amino acid transport system ATP-binding protein